VGVNCGALPRDLLASTLFGHRKGAFTGAQADRRGLFETADGGTLFLDEVTEASPEVQVHLLRALQEGEVMPVGATHPVKVDARVIVATNRDLAADVERHAFREDLYYRLSVFRIRVPSLDERPSDIPALVAHLIHRHSIRLNRSAPAITPEAMTLLQRTRYRGNVRELANVIERALILVDPGRPIDVGDLDSSPDTSAEATLDDDMAHFEREQIKRALEVTGGNKTHAAKSLGVTYRGLLKKMQRLGMP
jgi:transcriptional regulator with PAS, ATPase and Fis domain